MCKEFSSIADGEKSVVEVGFNQRNVVVWHPKLNQFEDEARMPESIERSNYI